MTNITTLRPGEHFMFKNFEWVCLDPNHPDGGVLAIMAKPWAKSAIFCPSNKFADENGNWNNYRTSSVRGILSDIANAVFEGKSLLPHVVDLVADNGDRSYGTAEDLMFLITCDEYRKYREFIQHYDDWIWTATPWTCNNNSSHVVRTIGNFGQIGEYNANCNNSVVPACILNPASLNLRQSMAYIEEVSE